MDRDGRHMSPDRTPQPSVQDTPDRSETTPKRRCFANLWAKAGAIDDEPKLQLTQRAASVGYAFTGEASEKSPLDFEFDQHFDVPASHVTSPIWKCPVNYFLFQQRAIRFQDFSDKSGRYQGKSGGTSDVHLSSGSAVVTPPCAIIKPTWEPTSSGKPLTCAKPNHSACWAFGSRSDS